jgi:ATP-dependent Lon protease
MMDELRNRELEARKEETVETEEAVEQEIPRERKLLPVLPLRNTVVFPTTVVPLAAGQPRSLRLIDDVASGDRLLVLVLQKDPKKEGAGPDDVYQVGTIGSIQQMMRVPDGTVRLAVHGLRRVRIVEWVAEEPYLKALVEEIPELVEDTIEVKALTRTALELFQRLVSLVSNLPEELVTAALNIDDPLHLVYLLASNLRMDPEERQALLELDSVRDKLLRLNAFMSRELDLLELGKKIQSEVQEEVARSQREFYLREQLKAIQRELGETSEQEAEINEFRAKIEQSGMPEEARREALRELERMSKLPPASAEYGVIRTYLDWLVSLPWNRSTEGEIDIARARQILDEDHYDLEKIKERILEYLAVRRPTQGARRGQRAWTRADSLLRGTAGCRQDESGPVDRSRARSSLHSYVAGWRSR